MTHYSTFFQTLVEIIITVVEKDPPWIMKRLNAKENLRKRHFNNFKNLGEK